MRKNIFYILISFIFISIFFNIEIKSNVIFPNKIQTAEAANPTITVKRENEREVTVPNYAQTKKMYGWSFSIKTTEVPNNSSVLINLYDDNGLNIQQITASVLNNEATHLTGDVLDFGVNYKITFEIKNPQTPIVEYSAKAGVAGSETISYKDPTFQTFDPLKNPIKSDVYTFLAPLTSEKTAPNDIGVYFNWIFTLAIGLCGALAVIMIVIGGVQYMGEESIFGKTEAKKQITNAILGLLIALGAYALLNTINPDLLKIDIKIEPVYSTTEKTAGGGYYGVEIGATGTNANKNITTYDAYLKSAAQEYGLSCTLLKAFMYAESSGVNGQTSPDNAQGLMQLLPGTFNEQGVGSNIMDPATNIMAGASYLNKLKTTGCAGKAKTSTCDISKIQYWAASYNGGPGANKDSTKCKGMTIWQCPQTICNDNTDCFRETRKYAPRVEDNFNKLTEKGWGC